MGGLPYAEKKIEDFRNQYEHQADFFLLDDLEDLQNKSGTQDELLSIMKQMHIRGASVILAGIHHPLQLQDYEQRIVTRLLEGLIIKIDHIEEVDSLHYFEEEVKKASSFAELKGLLLKQRVLSDSQDNTISFITELLKHIESITFK